MRLLQAVAVVLLALLLVADGGTAHAQKSGRSYSSGNKSSGSPGKSGSYGGGSKSSPSPGGRTYSPGSRPSPSPSRPPGGYTPSPSRPGGGSPSVGRKPSGGGYDAPAGQAQRREESRQAYTQGSRPKPSYTDGKGESKPIDPTDRRVEDLRRDLDRERYRNREQRRRDTFDPYWSRPVVVYHDPYSSLFWWWLMSQSVQTQAQWAYNHRSAMDEARYRDLLAQNRELEEKVKELEARGEPRNPSYTPPGLEPDLMYTDEYVDAAYNPQAPPPSSRGGGGMRLLTILAVLLLVGFVVWLVFFKRWNVS
jgi:hypothetical protein